VVHQEVDHQQEASVVVEAVVPQIKTMHQDLLLIREEEKNQQEVRVVEAKEEIVVEVPIEVAIAKEVVKKKLVLKTSLICSLEGKHQRNPMWPISLELLQQMRR
jgi:hypothetical protein